MTDTDVALGFTIPTRHARGRLVRLERTVAEVLSAHGYPAPVERLLAEALVLAALLGSTLKDEDGQLTLQAQTKGGAVDLLVANYQAGVMRGYARHEPTALAVMPADPPLATLLGKGHLAITFDQATTGERYQGIVPLEGGSLAEAAESYFAQSEQLPSLVRIAVADGRAGGLLIQHLPEGEEGRERIHTRLDHPEWAHVAALAATVRPEELTDPALDPARLVWRLFHEDAPRVLSPIAIRRGCRCDPEHIRAVIARFPPDERAAMADADGTITVDCEFCASRYPVRLAELSN